MEIFKLFGTILIDNAKANESMEQSESRAKKFATSLGDGIKTAAKWGAAIVAGAGAAATAMVAMADKAASATDRIDKMSQKIGLSREAFQEWDFICSQSGTSVEKLQIGLKTLNARMEEAVNGSGAGADAFEQLGVSATNANGELKSQEEVFEEMVLKLQEMPDGAEKARLAVDLFGKSGQELMPLLNGAAGSVEDMRQKAHELGLVLGDEAVDTGVAYTDMMDQLKRSLAAAATSIGVGLMPVIMEFGQLIIANMPIIQKVISAFFSVLSTAVNLTVESIGFLINVFKNMISNITGDSDALKTYINAFVEWLKEVFSLIKELVETVLRVVLELWQKYGDYIITAAKSAFEVIKTVVKTTMDLIKNILDVAIGILTGDWQRAWDGIKNIVSTTFQAIVNILPQLLQGVYNLLEGAANILVDLGKRMFSGLWDGMKWVWESVSSWVSEKVEWLKDKLTFWRDSQSEMSESGGGSKASRINGSHATGLAYVPFDGYIAELHKGEAIIPANQNPYTTAREVIQVINHFYIEGGIRSDKDIELLARELNKLQNRATRSKGVLS